MKTWHTRRSGWRGCETRSTSTQCFDYPGYGFSTGSIDVGAIRSAALEEFDYVRHHLASTGALLITYGWSIGSELAIHVAAQRSTAGLILQAPPASSTEMMKWSSHHDLPWFAHGTVKITADPGLSQVYEGAKEISGVNRPLLVIQGQKDDVVPISQEREVFQASPAEQKEFLEVPAAHHNDLRFTQPPASDAVGRFLNSIHQ